MQSKWRFWHKPKHKHSDPSVRIAALKQDDLEQSTVEDLAKRDPDPAVRKTAIGKLNDLRELVGMAAVTSDISEAARQRLANRLLGCGNLGQLYDISLDEALVACHEPVLTTKIARQAKLAEIGVGAARLLTDQHALHEITLNAQLSEVRQAACERLNDPDQLQQVVSATSKREPELARLARDRIDQISAETARVERIADLLTGLRALAEDELKQGASNDLLRLRRQWQELGDQPDADQQGQFEQLGKAAEERIQAWLAQRKRDEQSRHAKQALLETLEALAKEDDLETLEKRAEQVEQLHQQWQALPPLENPAAEAILLERHQDLSKRIRAALNLGKERAQQQSVLLKLVRQCDSLLAAERLTEKKVAEIHEAFAFRREKGERDLVARIGTQLARIDDKLKQQREGDLKHIDELGKTMAHLEQALEENHVQPATSHHRHVEQLLKDLEGAHDPAIRQARDRLKALLPRLRELQSWKRWGTSTARHELIDEAHELAEQPADDIDARIEAVKHLRQHWRKLGPFKDEAMHKEFDDALDQAFAPVKAHRGEVANQRKQHLTTREAICAELETLLKDTDWRGMEDWRGMDKGIQAIRKRWREAGEVDRKGWIKIKQRFDTVMDQLDDKLGDERRRNRRRREALIERVEALADLEDNKQAISEAKAAQTEWQVTVSGKPGEEQKLWERFRAAIDQVFQRDRDARDHFRQELVEHLEQRRALAAELEALAELDDDQIRAKHHEPERLREAFDAVGEPPRSEQKAIEERFRKAEKAYAARLEQADAAATAAEFAALGLRAEQCVAIEQAVLAADAELLDEARAAWQAAPALSDDQAESGLAKRVAAALAGQAESEKLAAWRQTLAPNATRAAEICLDLEILCGVESPADQQEARMTRQVDRLADAMRGENEDADLEIGQLKREFRLLGPLDADQREALEQRFARLADASRHA